MHDFPITGVPIGHFPHLIHALAMVKKAAARANRKLGTLEEAKAEAIERACDAIIGGSSPISSSWIRFRAAREPRPT